MVDDTRIDESDYKADDNNDDAASDLGTDEGPENVKCADDTAEGEDGIATNNQSMLYVPKRCVK